MGWEIGNREECGRQPETFEGLVTVDITSFYGPCGPYSPHLHSLSSTIFIPPLRSLIFDNILHFVFKFLLFCFSTTSFLLAIDDFLCLCVLASMADTGASGSGGRMWCSVPERLQLHMAMLALQFGYAGFHVVSRAALNMGISKLVFPVYRNVIALLLLLPFAYFLEKKERPAITLNFLLQFFLLALVGITANQGFYLLGLDNTSPTFASAIQNSVPAITFLMAAILRHDRESKTRPKRRYRKSDWNCLLCCRCLP
ncbi:hypothetical protein Pint_09045 [Pistacia integerrima]|uniref:Uncharacterized protein n=1 Tax=Pistacia integerrima TaxID=434235 RepID=A0ACC0XSR8_9ROSI|nr:hypothetical protein Pint_09045 [Pistacia integerrima]